MSKYDDLVCKLKEIFQIDRPELDFGVYRILNCRAGEIIDYLENRLKTRVGEILSDSGNARGEHLQQALKEKEEQYRVDGIDPDSMPRVRELKDQLTAWRQSAAEHENAVFSHLLTFFSRYYDQGDFISRRRYRGDTYAIPYSGEEVVLHWANKDQYYTKSSENFANYAFKLDDGRSVSFRLIAADTARDNRKDNDKERRFVLIEPHTRMVTDEAGDEYEEELLPITEENGGLVIRFEYKVMPKGTRQDELVNRGVKTILDDPIVKTRWLDLSQRAPTEKKPQRTVLEKCLIGYTAKNTADFFIHKDLGGFLRRELDFYIKNDVMNLDDIQRAETFADIEKKLRMIQTLRAIALDLIAFLAQLEDFQKKLWLKKKFVISAHYCFTLDRIPESLYPAIADNPKQWDQWQKLGMLDDKRVDLFHQAKPRTIQYLKEHPHLMADTALFDDTFKQTLLASMDDLDENLDGLLIHGDNFQTLNLLQERYREQVKCIYIDPPYNTDAAPIIYKNGFKISTWIILIKNVIDFTKYFLNTQGVICVTIDDFQQKELHTIIQQSLGMNSILGTVVIRNNPSGRPVPSGFAIAHEYAIFACTNPNLTIQKLKRSEIHNKRYKEQDKQGKFMWELLRKRGSNSRRDDARKSYFPFYVSDKRIRLPDLEWKEEKAEWVAKEKPLPNEVVVYPIDENGIERNWRWGIDTAIDNINELKVEKKAGGVIVYYKFRQPVGATPTTNWIDSRYSATEHGTGLVKHFFIEYQPFSYPKSIFAVEDSISIAGMRSGCMDICMDYFAGSGTTGHAVINLNREDNGKRKYILVEQGEYFDTVLKPRIQKVVYSADWKDGKATSPDTGISHAFKVLKIESYEDTLNNLELRRTPQQQLALDTFMPSVREDYLLHYMLEIESRGSLLSVDHFDCPFDCKLKVALDSAGAYEVRRIDLVETFNYLIGLRVTRIDMQRANGYALVTGRLPSGEKTLILWRDVQQVNHETLNRLLESLDVSPESNPFDLIYINGDHNIPTVFTSTEAEGGVTRTMKMRQIEPEFFSRMFSGEDA